MKKLITILLLLHLSNLSFAQFSLVDTSYSYMYDDLTYITFDFDEDFFKLRRSTDRYYTLGLDLGVNWYAGDRVFNTGLWKRTVPKSTDAYLGIGIGNEIYTPINLEKEEPDEFDRPYAGFTYFYVKSILNDFYAGKRLSYKVKIGALGAWSGSDSIQTKFHRITEESLGSVIPRGWGKQIASDFGTNINVKYEQSLLEFSSLMDFIPYIEGNVGTVSNNIGVGFLFRLGLFNDYFSNEIGARFSESKIRYLQKEYYSKHRKRTIFWNNLRRRYKFHYFFKSELRGVVDNSFLQGGMFTRKKNKEEGRHVIGADDLERFYLRGEVGISMNIGNVQIIISQLFQTKEYKNSKNLHWGKLSINFPIEKIRNQQDLIRHKIDPFQEAGKN